MRRTTTALLAGLLIAATASCSSGNSASSKPSASPSQSVEPVVPFMKSVEAANLPSYTDGIPAYQDLEQFPPKWCAALRDGHSVAWMLDDGGLYPIGEDWGTQKADAYQLVLLGVEAYCPKYKGQVQGELRQLGVY
jgi:hypothetical protein